VTKLELLRPDHAAAVLTFEQDNRAFFATMISDRGDAYFEHFAEGFRDLLAEQETGAGAFFVLVDDGPTVLGRFNLTFGTDSTARLGYRVAERAGGRGVATAGVREVCRLAAAAYGVRTIRAAASDSNLASRRVLIKTGFVPIGPAQPADLGGKSGTLYQRDLTAESACT
jgi:ribosomal-protein-alanine N-acetyltransferase